MTNFSAWPMYAYSWADPHVDLENPRFVISVEWTWPEGDWTHFSIVRSTRSPATRREEGQVMMETKGKVWDQFAHQTTGLPVYRDPQPPPGEWVYYSAFVLDEFRVWQYAGSQCEISIEDYDWALRLPEIFPGVSVGDLARSISPADQSNDLVQFLQPPGALLDRVVTMGETAQYFWDPLRVPPQMFRALVESLGFRYDDAIGVGRMRYVLDALMGMTQGSLTSVRKFTAGATGCDTRVEISNNLMLDVNDSSFESGILTRVEPDASTTVVTRWQPLANLELRKYEDYSLKVPTLHPNVQVGWFMYFKAAGTYTCGPNYGPGYTSKVVANPTIIQQGIPVAGWNMLRMGLHAYKPSPTAVTLAMGMKVYDYLGRFLWDTPVMSLTAGIITEEWKWYGSDNAGAGIVFPQTGPGSPAEDLLKTAMWWVDSSETLPPYTNLLTVNQASVETDTVGFSVDSNCTITRSTAQAAHGTASLAITATATTYMGARTLGSTSGVPVTPGETYTAVANFRAATVARGIEIDIAWYTSAGTYISKSAVLFPSGQETTTSWFKATVTDVAPVDAAFAAVVMVVQSPNMSEVHYVDKIGLWKGTGTVWGLPGNPRILARLTDLTGNGKDLMSPDAAYPVLLPYSGTPYLSIPTGTANFNHISGIIPNVPGTARMTWDIQTMDSLGQGITLINNAAAVGAVYVGITSTGSFIVQTWTTGPTAQTLTWASAVPVNSRKTYVVDLTTTGATLTIDGVSQGLKTFGATRVPAVNTTSNLLIPTTASTPSINIRVYSFNLYDALIFNPANVNTTYSTVTNTGSAGGTWTITRAATGNKAAIVDRPLVQFGGAQSMQTANWTSLPIGTYMMALRHYADTATNTLIQTETGATNGFRTSVEPSTNYVSSKVGSGTTMSMLPPSMGPRVVGLTYDGTNIRMTMDGKFSDAVAGNGSFLKDFVFIGGDTMSSMHFIAAAVWDRVLTDTEILQVTAELPAKGSLGPAYAVPWITVSNPCSVDLIVVDDG